MMTQNPDIDQLLKGVGNIVVVNRCTEQSASFDENALNASRSPTP